MNRQHNNNDRMNIKSSKIRVAIVDDDPFVRMSLSTILSAQEDIVVIGEGESGLEAQRLYCETNPDILLMDIQMPECTGLEAAEAVLRNNKDARIVFLTTFSDDEYIVSALRLGARGYLIKQEVANIAPALRSVMLGHMVLGGEVIARVDSLVKGSKAEGSSKKTLIDIGLSDREAEIIGLIAEGFDNKEIAASVYISEGTVRNHVSTILQKLGLKNRTQLAVYYYQHLQ